MAIRPNGTVFRQIRTLFDVGVVGDLTDAQLLERFTTLDREAAERAFAALVERHGPMVLRVCRNFLNCPHDVDDAFQGTFLVLVHKARWLWVRDSLAPWLHRVAHRVASRVRASTVRRREHERRAAELRPTQVDGEHVADGLLGLLHNEIDRLPQRYGLVFVLCELEGLSHERAARQLSWPLGTVKSRLARARQILRSRLVHRGLKGPTILVITKAAKSSVDAGVSLRMVESTLQAVLVLAKAPTIDVISARVAILTEEVLKTMFLTKLKLIFAAVLTTSALAIGTASVLGRQGNRFDRVPAPDDTKAKKSGTGRAATGDGAIPAPAFIKQSRGMIITRLEQELDLAQNRLERTLRRVRATDDPAAAQGRKAVDEIEGLLGRIDDVLVDAVDRFPTMFDFSGGQGDFGSNSSTTNSGTLLQLNGNDVYRSSAQKFGNGQKNSINDRASNQNSKSSADANKDPQIVQHRESPFQKSDDGQQSNQQGDQRNNPPTGWSNDRQNGQNNAWSSPKSGDGQNNKRGDYQSDNSSQQSSQPKPTSSRPSQSEQSHSNAPSQQAGSSQPHGKSSSPGSGGHSSGSQGSGSQGKSGSPDSGPPIDRSQGSGSQDPVSQGSHAQEPNSQGGKSGKRD